MEVILGIILIYIFYRIFNSSKQKSSDQSFSYQNSNSINKSSDEYIKREKERVQKTHAKNILEPALWIKKSQNITIQGYDIRDGMIYVGEKLSDSYGYDNDASLINPKLQVTPSEPWETDDEMGYWPRYENLGKKCRGAYLKWLADGRSEPEANIGYIFLFFYGLERRLFIDGQKEGLSEIERMDIIEETKRLLEIYGENRSFRGYANNLLAMEWVLYQKDKPLPNYIDLSDRYCLEPFQVALSQYVVAEKAIPADIAFQWVILHPEFGVKTPARRCPNEFRALFSRRYHAQFGDGLVVKPNKTPLKLTYRPASPSLRGDLKLKIPNLPNPFILTAPLKKLSVLVESCTQELEAYSRYLAKKTNNPDSLAAISLLPKELICEWPLTSKIKRNLEKISLDKFELISIDELYAFFEDNIPSEIGKKDLEILGTILEGMGYGIAPDVRFHNIKVTLESKVVVFKKTNELVLNPSKEFHTMNSILRLGALISQIDDDVSPAEEATLQKLISNNSYLSDIEKEFLAAFLAWCLKTPQGTLGIKQKLSDISLKEKKAISHILITVAHADGRIDPKEIKQLEKLYTLLGLDKEQVTSDIHTLSTANEPITVSLKDHDTSFAISKPITETNIPQGFQLNEELIKIREEETRQVKGVLEEIFSDPVEDETSVSNDLTEMITNNNPLMALDQAHQALFNKLITQEMWERAAIHEICQELGLMVDGALEVLNEWAYDNVNAPLIDDGEPIYVDIDLSKEIINVK